MKTDHKARSPPAIKETPSTNPELLDVWRALYSELTTNQHPKWRALQIIGDRYGVYASTVEYYLFPQRREKQKKYQSKRWSYEKQDPTKREKITAYKALYMAARRHLPELLEKAIENSDEPMELSDLVIRLQEVSGVMFRPSSILGLSQHFEAKKGYPLLVEVPGCGVAYYKLSKKAHQ